MALHPSPVIYPRSTNCQLSLPPAIAIITTFAGFERDLIIERVKTVIDGDKKRGKFCGVPMRGYRSDQFSKKLLINEEEAATGRLIFEKYMALISLLLICEHTNFNSSKGISHIP